jgi:ABC-type Fe3+ transport system permease subunit
MRRILVTASLVTASVLALGLALAQDVSIPTNIPTNLAECPKDLAEWFDSPTSLAVEVAALVALIRKHFWRSLDGMMVVWVSVVLGIALAYLSHRLNCLGANWFAFGLMAGLLAPGGVAAVRSALKVGGGDAPGPTGGTPTDADRAPLR